MYISFYTVGVVVALSQSRVFFYPPLRIKRCIGMFLCDPYFKYLWMKKKKKHVLSFHAYIKLCKASSYGKRCEIYENCE